MSYPNLFYLHQAWNTNKKFVKIIQSRNFYASTGHVLNSFGGEKEKEIVGASRENNNELIKVLFRLNF